MGFLPLAPPGKPLKLNKEIVLDLSVCAQLHIRMGSSLIGLVTLLEKAEALSCAARRQPSTSQEECSHQDVLTL